MNYSRYILLNHLDQNLPPTSLNHFILIPFIHKYVSIIHETTINKNRLTTMKQSRRSKVMASSAFCVQNQKDTHDILLDMPDDLRTEIPNLDQVCNTLLEACILWLSECI